jgi:hypothetical protein
MASDRLDGDRKACDQVVIRCMAFVWNLIGLKAGWITSDQLDGDWMASDCLGWLRDGV